MARHAGRFGKIVWLKTSHRVPLFFEAAYCARNWCHAGCSYRYGRRPTEVGLSRYCIATGTAKREAAPAASYESSGRLPMLPMPPFRLALVFHFLAAILVADFESDSEAPQAGDVANDFVEVGGQRAAVVLHVAQG